MTKHNRTADRLTLPETVTTDVGAATDVLFCTDRDHKAAGTIWRRRQRFPEYGVELTAGVGGSGRMQQSRVVDELAESGLVIRTKGGHATSAGCRTRAMKQSERFAACRAWRKPSRRCSEYRKSGEVTTPFPPGSANRGFVRRSLPASASTSRATMTLSFCWRTCDGPSVPHCGGSGSNRERTCSAGRATA